MKTELAQRIEQRRSVVGILGLGYVGLPLAAAFHDAGFPVLGFDIDPEKVKALKAGQSYLKHLGDSLLPTLRSSRFEPTADFSRCKEADALIICVPTPLDTYLQPDLSYVEATAEAAAKTLRKGQIIVLESTTYPGTTREVLLPRFEASGLRCGVDYFLAFSPEREDPGRQDFNTRSIPKLVGGIDPASGELAVALYRQAIKQVVPVSTAEVAESAKLLENIFRSVNIAMVNEMKVVLTAMGINVWEVIEAAATKPFGFMPFYPGPGLGGHCIPIDPFYLTWKAREFDLATKFIELAGEVNRSMPAYVVDRTLLSLNQRGKAVSQARILVLGLAYKPDVDDTRESPTFALIDRFQKLGARVDYSDPLVPSIGRTRHYNFEARSVPLNADSLRSYDAVVVSTHHKAFDWQLIANHAQLIVDTRNALKNVTGRRDHIVLA